MTTANIQARLAKEVAQFMMERYVLEAGMNSDGIGACDDEEDGWRCQR